MPKKRAPRSKFFTVRINIPPGIEMGADAPRLIDIDHRLCRNAQDHAAGIRALAAHLKMPAGVTVRVERDDGSRYESWTRIEGGWVRGEVERDEDWDPAVIARVAAATAKMSP